MTAPTTHPITFRDLVYRYPALEGIFADAEQTRDWTRLACLRADVRALHMSPGEEAVTLGLLREYAPVLIPVRQERQAA